MEQKKTYLYISVVASVFFFLSILAWIKPAEDFSVTERRQLEQFPLLQTETILDGRFMGDFEDYTLDQFPFRDNFRSIKAMVHFYLYGQSDNNDVYRAEGYISKLDYPLSERAMDQAVKKFHSICDTFISGTDAKLYYSIIPDKNYFLAEKNGYLAYDYDEMFSYFEKNLSDMTYIDITDRLTLEDFYHTDTHWKQENIVDVAQALGDAMGTKLEGDYQAVTLDTPFYGVYYGQLALPVEADRISYLTHADFEDCVIINHETGKEIPMYDLERVQGRDPYEMYLSGSVSAITIVNPHASTDKELVVFRDSFGSSLTPLFVEGYAKITLIDLRYISEIMVGRLVEFDTQDVLFIHSTSVLNNETAF